MAEHPDLTAEELFRAESWLICLQDSLAYIAVARGKEHIAPNNPFFKFKLGTVRVGHVIETGLLAAAIVAAGQIFKSGGAGPGIANNQVPKLKVLRELLFECSDQANKWDRGRSATVFRELVSENRDKFLSHYDGGAANIQPLDGVFDGISWRSPNPWFTADAFGDLESILYQMHRSLRRYVQTQQTALKSSGSF